MSRIPTLVLAILVVAACGKKEDAEPSAKGGGAAKIDEATLAAINAAVPAELQGKLKFVVATLEKEPFVGVAPEGWKSDVIPGNFRPADTDALGFMTSYHLSTNCDGACKPKDWAKAADDTNFKQFSDPQYKIVKDEKTETSRILIAKSEDKREPAGENTFSVTEGRTHLVMAWWKKDAKHYVYCSADLTHEIEAALPAFEKACAATQIKW